MSLRLPLSTAMSLPFDTAAKRMSPPLVDPGTVVFCHTFVSPTAIADWALPSNCTVCVVAPSDFNVIVAE